MEAETQLVCPGSSSLAQTVFACSPLDISIPADGFSSQTSPHVYPTTMAFGHSLAAYMMNNRASPGLYPEAGDMRLDSPSLASASAPSATSSAISTPQSIDRQGPLSDWNAHGIGIQPSIVGYDYIRNAEYNSEYTSFTGFGMEELAFDFTNSKGSVDPSLIQPEITRPMDIPYDRCQQPNMMRTNNFSSLLHNSPFQPIRPYGAPMENDVCAPGGNYTSPDDIKEKQRCTWPDCGKIFKDLKAHMLTHQNERPEKCPIQTCEYHIKGFARKYDKNRHTLTHYKGTMVCGFCPGSGSAAEKSFNRADVFKRHLAAVHGVEQSPPNSRKKSAAIANSRKKLTGYASDATGKCSTCSQTFSNAQDFYEHLDDCVLRIVQQEDPAEAINAQRLAEVENDKDVHQTLEKNNLHTTVQTGSFEEDDGDCDKADDQDAEELELATSVSQKRVNPPGGVQKSRGMTHSRGGVILATKTKGRKSKRDYPSSWGFDKGQITRKKRVMAVLDGPRRLAKDDMMLSTEHEVRIELTGEKSCMTNFDVQTMNNFSGPLLILDGSTEEKPGDDLSHHETDILPINNDANVTVETTSAIKIDLNIVQFPSAALPKQETGEHTIKEEPEEQPSSPTREVESDIPTQGPHDLSTASTPFTDTNSFTTASCSSSDMAPSPESIPSPRTMASSRKDVIIKHVLKKMQTWLDSRLTLLAFQCDSGSNSPVASGQPPTPSPGETQNGQPRCRQKRSRGQDGAKDSDDEGTDEGKDNNGGPPETKRIKTESGDAREFACPFYQHNRRKYETWRCCAWSGWKSVHRVKEHVYRKHRLPKFRCNRCCEEFKASIQLLEHQRSKMAFEVRVSELQEGVNEEQVLQLRSRRKPNGTLSEEEKWNETYRIIFPDDELIPSPYHDRNRQNELKDEDAFDGRSNILRDLGDHARRELPRLMRPRLENMLDSVIEEGLTSDRVVNLAQGVFEQILQNFKVSRDEPVRSFTGGAETVGNGGSEAIGMSMTPDEGIAGLNMDEQSISPTSKKSWMDETVPSMLLQNVAISQESPGVLDIFQTTVVDSLGDSQWCNFEDFFRLSGDDISQTDSGYQSLGPSDLDKAQNLEYMPGY
ncbi:Zinc finger protein PLAG1 [Ilyonectria robusta]